MPFFVTRGGVFVKKLKTLLTKHLKLMLTQADREKLKRTHIPDICRYILAVTFIFSGFIKTIDPWGTILKVGEYMTAFHFEWLLGWKVGLAIWLCAAELMMGCMLLFRVRLRLISVFSVLTMTIFTILTFILAVWSPLEDCGCFGDTIHLTNWQSFFKNLILFPMSVVMWWSERDRHFFPFSTLEGVLTVVFMTLAGTLGYWCYRHLPIIDLLPFKEGVNIAEGALAEQGDNLHSTVVCRNKNTGKEQQFEMDDTTWYDDSVWEYIDTRTEGGNSDRPTVSLSDFRIFDSSGDVTEQILSDSGVTNMLCLQNMDNLNDRIAMHFAKAIDCATANGNSVICLTSSALDSSPAFVEFEGRSVRCYNIDPTVLQVMMRAKAGMVTVENGTIVDKRAVYDIK